jgi:hypothetical protein
MRIALRGGRETGGEPAGSHSAVSKVSGDSLEQWLFRNLFYAQRQGDRRNDAIRVADGRELKLSELAVRVSVMLGACCSYDLA